jgi:hypothetical protein
MKAMFQIRIHFMRIRNRIQLKIELLIRIQGANRMWTRIPAFLYPSFVDIKLNISIFSHLFIVGGRLYAFNF